MNARDHLPLTPLSFQILVALADVPRHGYGIIKEIEKRAGEALKSSTGTLYLAVQRLEQEGLIEEAMKEGRRRSYRLTDLGRQVAAAEAKRLTLLLAIAREKKLLENPA